MDVIPLKDRNSRKRNAGGKGHAVAGKAEVLVGIDQPLFDLIEDFVVNGAHTGTSLLVRPGGRWFREFHDPVHIPPG